MDIAICEEAVTADTSSVKTQQIQIENGLNIIQGDSRKALSDIEDGYFQSCITSPPYWGLRDYGIDGQVGAEMKVTEYIEDLVAIFREVRRTLKDDGTLWLNIGDSYTSGGRKWRDSDKKNEARGMSYRAPTPEGLKKKDLIGVPWMIAFALQADGWYLRSDIIWYKPNCQPESVKDRPTRSHEYVFLLSKNEKYQYNHQAIKEPRTDGKGLRNKRTVWSINTEPFKDAHFAVFPKELVRQCMLASSDGNSVILDPFLGSGTVMQVASELGRKCTGIELNPEFIDIAKRRLAQTSF